MFTRYDKLDETYNAFAALANINIFLKNECQHALARNCRLTLLPKSSLRITIGIPVYQQGTAQILFFPT
jgi:hypothetical protein